MKGLELFKKYWKSIVVAILALFLGNAIGMGTSSPEHESVEALAEGLDTENAEYKEQIKELEAQIKEKDARIKEAEPFFKLQEEERIAKEAEAKAAEEKRIAEAADAEAKRIVEEEAKKAEAKENVTVSQRNAIRQAQTVSSAIQHFRRKD